MKKNIISFLALVLVAGCASNGSGDNTAKNDAGYRCERVKSISSHIPKKVCNNRAQRKEIEERSKEGLRNTQRTISDVVTHGG